MADLLVAQGVTKRFGGLVAVNSVDFTIQERAIECDYQVQDSLFVARTARAFRKVVEAEHRTHVSLGYRSTLYDRGSLGAIIGARAYHGGIRYAGTFGINSYANDPHAPFGGYKQSGIGRENGREGLESCLEHKSVMMPLGYQVPA